MIEHVVNLWPAMEEVTRLLKPGGPVVLATPNVASLRSRIALLMDVFPLSKAKQGFDVQGDAEPHDGGHLHYFTFSMLDRLFVRYGYSQVDRFGFGHLGRFHNLRPTLLSPACLVVAKK